jgi:hypothetical protein
MRLPIIAAALFLAGSAQAGPIANAVQQFTVSDLRAALADASAQTPPDTRHGKCWAAAIPVAEQWQAPVHLPSAPGAASLAQAFFDAQNGIGKPLLPDAVAEACAETVLDLGMSLAQFAGLLGVQALPLPHLPIGLHLPITLR